MAHGALGMRASFNPISPLLNYIGPFLRIVSAFSMTLSTQKIHLLLGRFLPPAAPCWPLSIRLLPNLHPYNRFEGHVILTSMAYSSLLYCSGLLGARKGANWNSVEELC